MPTSTGVLNGELIACEYSGIVRDAFIARATMRHILRSAAY